MAGALLPGGSWGTAGAAGPVPAAVNPLVEQPERDDPAAAQAWFLGRRLPPGQTAAAERALTARDLSDRALTARYVAAREHMRHMPHHAARAVAGTAAPGTWQPLGPGNLGGRTRALVFDPTTVRIIYAAGVDGGVWKTTNGGASWSALDDLLPSLAVSSLALDPAHHLVLYAGTGEGYFNSDAVRGAGIFKTVDGGAHWQQLAATATPDFYAVNSLVVSGRTGTLYAATGTGVWRSRDGGATWGQRLAPRVEGGCLGLALRTDLPDDVVFASCGTFQQATVYRNLHAQKGALFFPVLSVPGMGRTSLAIAPSSPSVIYALAASNLSGPGNHYSQGLLGVYRSSSGGAAGSWTAQVLNSDPVPLNTALLSSTRFAFQHDCGAELPDLWSGRGWYDNVIAVDPTDPDRVWAGGVDLFRSDDGGHSWGLANYWWAGEQGAAGGFAHADQHALVFHPHYDGVHNQTLLVAGDGGIYRTQNALGAVASGPGAACNTAGSAVVWTSLDNGYAVAQFYQGAVFPGGGSYVGGAQDLGTLTGSDAAGPNGWRQVLGQDGGFVAIDPTDPATVYAESDSLSLVKSTDGGNTFAAAVTGINSGSFPFIVPFVLDPADPQRLWLGGDSLWTSGNGAASWSRASPSLGGNALDLVSAIAVSPSDGQHVLAGTSQGSINRNDAALTSTAGTVWPSAQPAAGYLSALVYDPQSPSTVYATYSTFGVPHVWKSLDGGTTWLSLGGSGAGALPDLPVHALAVDPADAQHLYIGTDLGVFVTANGGISWAVEDSGFANVLVESLVLGPAGAGAPHGAVFAFTHGRGAWRLTLP